MNYCQKYDYVPQPQKIEAAIARIAQNAASLASPEVFKTCFSFMDLTTLHSNDTADSVRKLVGKVTALQKEYPTYPLPASVCVYPNFAAVVKAARPSAELHVTTVASCFPSAQSYLEVKVRECELAVENGADEIDIVLALG